MDSWQSFKVLKFSAHPNAVCVLFVALEIFSGMQVSIQRINSYAWFNVFLYARGFTWIAHLICTTCYEVPK